MTAPAATPATTRADRRRGTPADLLVVGLGNPGAEYERSRHNVGAEVVALLAERHGARLRRSKEHAHADEVRVGAKRLALAVPLTYMNESGQAVAPLVRRYGIEDTSHLAVVHDELDLEQGRLKVKLGGGLAGHNGLRSIDAHLHTRDFVRVRMGVGKPPGGADRGADWVLSKVRGSARTELDVMVAEAVDAIDLIATDGVDAAMQRVNQRG